MELWPEDVSLLERCPHFKRCCVQAGFNGVVASLLERSPHLSGCIQ